MKSLSIAKLQTTPVLIYPDIIDLFDIYTYHIRPFINDEALRYEQSVACSRTSSFVRNDKKWFLVNNFELFHIAKSPYIDFDVLRKEVAVKYISKNQFDFDISFYELIDLIAKYNKKIDIKLIHAQLNEILDQEINQKLFGKNIFAVTKFCELIHISEQTYHARRFGILL
ncbi:hypothetical protein ACFPZK_01855 [Psychrobacter urativorans]|uniref:hypothetical protein n=1 Tax=Psychrobacter urativorans TaxID=45610 RepID=UPI001918C32E|nr:hypothetical protein [Psychrobacter urativorans]